MEAARMIRRVVCLGDSASVFSGNHSALLLQTPCSVVAFVDVPPNHRVATDTGGDGAPASPRDVLRPLGVCEGSLLTAGPETGGG